MAEHDEGKVRGSGVKATPATGKAASAAPDAKQGAKPVATPVAPAKAPAPRGRPAAKAPVAQVAAKSATKVATKPAAKVARRIPAPKAPAARPEAATPKSAAQASISGNVPPQPTTAVRAPAMYDPVGAATLDDIPVRAARTPATQKKEITMANIPDNVTKGVQNIVNEAQAKGREAVERSTQFFGNVGEFAKGNIEAVIETNQILATGIKDLASQVLEETRTVVDNTVQDVKELAAAKSPADFLKIQSELARKNMDAAVAFSSRNSETVFKLVNDAMAPVSGRLSVAMQKVRTASI